MPKALTDYQIREIVDNAGYVFLNTEIKNKKKYINLICQNGHQYLTRVDQFKNGCRCKECQRLTYDIVKKNIEKNGYKLIANKYINYHSKLDMLCPNGHEISMEYANFIQGKRCKFCANNVKHSYDFVKAYIESFNGYKLLSLDYINWEGLLSIQCPEGHIYKASYNSFYSGHRCQYCQRSFGEEKISKILDNNYIRYTPQFKFEDCKDSNPLPFDFYLNDLNILIEYQGRQHYESVDFFGGQLGFEMCKRHDQIKYDYCNNKKIKLITIPYWDFDNIEQIFKKEQIIS